MDRGRIDFEASTSRIKALEQVLIADVAVELDLADGAEVVVAQ